MQLTYQNVQALDRVDRIRANTASSVNHTLDREMFQRLIAYAALPSEEIAGRITALEKEWDIERSIEFQASLTALLSIWLAFRVNWKWIWLAVVNQGFLLQHSIQGWCPPVALQRSLKRRSRREIHFEILALRILRGDFGEIPAGDPVVRAQSAIQVAAGHLTYK